MKHLLRLVFVYIPALLLTLILAISGYVWQQDLMTKKDLLWLTNMARTEGLPVVWAIIRAELYGTSELSTDTSYDRRPVPGRGHSPWVLRGNLDAKPRMINFALAPQLWVSYDTQYAALYQVWQGDILFQGAVYDYRHGPQPEASGAWYIKHESPAQWYLKTTDSEQLLQAKVVYRGHRYGPGYKTAGLLYRIQAGVLSLNITEFPDLQVSDGEQSLLRTFHIENDAGAHAYYREAGGELVEATGTVIQRLQSPTPIETTAYQRQRTASDNVLDAGAAVIADSDCLGCHSEQHDVAGPAWARVAGRYLGNVQDESVAALSKSIIRGSKGKWGKQLMPPHPELTEQDAAAAVAYILTRSEAAVEVDAPLDDNGQPYAASHDFDINPRPKQLHPAFELENLIPEGFQPKVGGMDFGADGRLLVASWDADGAVFSIDLDAPLDRRVMRIAEGLHEPLGLAVVGDRLFVLQKQELTELIDTDGDRIIDEYRAFSTDWPSNSNFHSFAFGLTHKDDALYALLSICVLPGGASCPEQLPTQGKLLKISLQDGSAEIVASGLRTPNGIALGPQDAIYVTDNQGDWLPANKLIKIETGGFYGSRAVPDPGVMEAEEMPPAVWLPQDEIGNSPTQPLLLTEGPYRGQMIHGDVYNGGVKRAYIEEINGVTQGAAFQFSGGFTGAVNRLARGPDGAIYVGQVGNPPNWGEIGKQWYGLERISYTGKPAFEILQVNASADGFSITLSEPLASGTRLKAGDLIARQWFYRPTEQYGGPKYDDQVLTVGEVSLSDNRRRIKARIPGLKPGYVVYLRLDSRLKSDHGDSLWASEAWYTLNQIPPLDSSPADNDWQVLFDGESLAGWRNYGGKPGAIEKWRVEDGALHLQASRLGLLAMIKSYLFGGASGDLIYAEQTFQDFELSLEWKIAENGNSGIFYFVAGEDHNTPWQTGLEMQVLDNDGHADGKITRHRAGDLYDLVAAAPETVKPVGEWNKVRIVVSNNRIEHWLNGTRVVDIVRFSPEWDKRLAASKFADMPDFGVAPRGYIVLQDHGDPVWYRNIKIRRLGDPNG